MRAMRGLITAIVLVALTSTASAQVAPAPEELTAIPGADGPAAQPERPRKPAEMRADQLDILFGRLHQPGVQATPVEERIWELWSASDSPTAEVLLQQGQRAIEAGAPAEAMSILNRLIGAYPDYAEAWNKRATLYYMMKRDDAALKDLGHVLDLEPRHFGALAGKGMIFEREKNYTAARAAYEEALAVNPNLDQVKDAIKELDRLEQGI